MSKRQAVWSAVKRVSGAQVSTVEAAGIAHGVAGIGSSFDRSLLPRTTAQQAGVTGLWAALNYGLTATGQSVIEAGARRFGAGKVASPGKHRAAIIAADLTVAAAGIGVIKGLKQHPQESAFRASGRSAGWRMVVSGTAGTIALTADGIADLLSGQRGSPGADRRVNAMAVVAAGVAVSGGVYLWRSQRLSDTGVDVDQYGDSVADTASVRPLRAAMVGVGVSTGIFVLSRVESKAARSVAAGVSFVAPGLAPYSKAIGHAVLLGLSALAVERGVAAIYGVTEQAGEAIEPAYDQIPDSPYVSGGPASELDWTSFGREGRRYVNMALTAQDITAVTGEPAQDPIRAFVGLDSGVSPNSRAYRAREELEALGAFDRSTLVVFAPTGTGYVNYVAAETLEYLTGGDVASVAIQYSVRPSFLSLDRVHAAWESYLAFLNGLAGRLAGMPADKRPQVLLVGESLGSLASQDVFKQGGVRGFEMLGIDRAFFIGTPEASEWRNQWLADPEEVDPDNLVVEVSGLAEWEALPEERREGARIVLLTHHEDPIPKFGPSLIVQQPAWMGPAEERPAGVPGETIFVPGLTFLHVAVDLLNADNVVPGTFEAWGHDYRADVAQMVRVAFDIDVDPDTMERIEAALRQREFDWAQRRLVTEQAAKAEQVIRDKMQSWGIETNAIPNVVEAKTEGETDPYAVTEDTAPADAATDEAPDANPS